MRTEKEIKETVKIFNDLAKIGRLTEMAKLSRDMLLWVLGKDFRVKKEKKI